jgi:hypothetical protein
LFHCFNRRTFIITQRFSHNRFLPLVAGDVLTFLPFAALGRRAHSMGSALDDVVGTAVPFMVAWFVVAPFTGAFRRDATSNPTQGAKRAGLTWLLAFPLGLLIRTPIVGRLPHISFAIVAGVFTLLFLTGWRALFALQSDDRRRTTDDR